MKSVKRNSYEEQCIKNLLNPDVSFQNELNTNDKNDEFGDIYSYLNKSKPELISNPNPAMKAFTESNEIAKVKEFSTGKQFSSYIGAKNLMDVYKNLESSFEKECKKKDPDYDEKSEEEKLQMMDELIQKSPMKVKIRINQKIKEAVENTDDELNTAKAIGYGGNSNGEKGLPEKRVIQFLDMMKKNEMVKKIMRFAGKMINTAKHNIASRCTGNEDIIGVEYGDAINRVIPTELALFCDERFVKMQNLKYLKKELIQYEKESNESKTIGDIVVVLDESGSMRIDDNIVKAKALLFGIMEQSKHDNRKVQLIGFGGKHEHYLVKDLTMDKLLDVISVFKSYGDTDFEYPLNTAIEMCGNHSDIIFITDGYAPISGKLIADVEAAKENLNVKIITMQFGNVCNEDLEKISSSFNTTWSLFTDKALT